MYLSLCDNLILRTLKYDIQHVMEFGSIAPLTQANLALPQYQVQETCRAEAFVHRQRLLQSSTFANGGGALDRLQLCDATALETPPLPSTKIEGVGFSSPILKARIDRVQGATAASVLAEESADASDDRKASKGSIKQVRKRKPPMQCAGKGSKNKPTSRIRSAVDDEHAARK